MSPLASFHNCTWNSFTSFFIQSIADHWIIRSFRCSQKQKIMVNSFFCPMINKLHVKTNHYYHPWPWSILSSQSRVLTPRLKENSKLFILCCGNLLNSQTLPWNKFAQINFSWEYWKTLRPWPLTGCVCDVLSETGSGERNGNHNFVQTFVL